MKKLIGIFLLCLVPRLSSTELSVSTLEKEQCEIVSIDPSFSNNHLLRVLQQGSLSALNTVKTDFGLNGPIPDTGLYDEVLRGVRLTIYQIILAQLLSKGLQLYLDKFHVYTSNFNPPPNYQLYSNGAINNWVISNPEKIIIIGPLIEEVLFTYIPFLFLKNKQATCSAKQYHYLKLITAGTVSLVWGINHYEHTQWRSPLYNFVLAFSIRLLTTYSSFEHQKAPLSPLIASVLNNAYWWSRIDYYSVS